MQTTTMISFNIESLRTSLSVILSTRKELTTVVSILFIELISTTPLLTSTSSLSVCQITGAILPTQVKYVTDVLTLSKKH